jgi:hypothetical protein
MRDLQSLGYNPEEKLVQKSLHTFHIKVTDSFLVQTLSTSSIFVSSTALTWHAVMPMLEDRGLMVGVLGHLRAISSRLLTRL